MLLNYNTWARKAVNHWARDAWATQAENKTVERYIGMEGKNVLMLVQWGKRHRKVVKCHKISTSTEQVPFSRKTGNTCFEWLEWNYDYETCSLNCMWLLPVFTVIHLGWIVHLLSIKSLEVLEETDRIFTLIDPGTMWIHCVSACFIGVVDMICFSGD